MHTTQDHDFFFTYREGFDMYTGRKNPSVVGDQPSFTQSSLFSTLVFNCVDNTQYFPLLIDSNSFCTVAYDAHINTKTVLFISHVFRSKTLRELIT